MIRILPLLLLTCLMTGTLQAQNSVKTKDAVNINGITQWIGVNGKDDSKPVLLFLHGGPGFSSRPYSRKFVKGLRKDFIVVQWDQRESGITASWSPMQEPLTLDMFHQDTYEVVQYLRKRFDREKIYLVGFSWGATLGLHFAKQHPELLHAYVSVSGSPHTEESERLTLERLKEKAEASHNEEALQEISQIEIPFQQWEALYYQRKWTAYYSGVKTNSKTYPASLFEKWSVKWLPLFVEASRVNYFESAAEIHCPIYFFHSNKDYASNYKLTEKYFHALKAEHKRMVWFEKSTHEIPNQEPEKFSEELIKISHSL
ncbi:alpha/beta hydrolase family protein [Catalinimonas niigatensis]|uniref:alpha/beta hydrolase family protein n=1 Tax=Catalinimonas niigatensis TaxID=1397264 RepID=UPI0026658900|nr:alpha/beta hydrolase [Catalinimonas niigatensis]WPP49848.1 alpha/beta hydrolase [Catalinimonas niigatensis]